jgi:hypothetical protein
VPLVEPVLQVKNEIKVIKEISEILVLLVHKVIKEISEILVLLVHKV